MQQPVLIQQKQATSPLVYLISAGFLGVAGFFGYRAIKQAQSDAEQKKAAADPNTNLANQIFSELEKNNPDDDNLVSLFSQITDFAAVSASYRLISKGTDMVNHLQSKTFVSASTVQTIMSLLANKSGAVKPTSQVAKEVTDSVNKGTTIWLVATQDVRVRKSPRAYDFTSSLLKLRSNVFDTVKYNETVGFLNVAEFNKNGKKLIFDPIHKVYFFPILVFVGNKVQPAYVAASAVKSVTAKQSPSKPVVFLKMNYDSASYLSGVEGVAATVSKLI